MAEATVPITILVPRGLRRWLETRARGEEKKLGPYVRKVLEAHRTAEDSASQSDAVIVK